MTPASCKRISFFYTIDNDQDDDKLMELFGNIKKRGSIDTDPVGIRLALLLGLGGVGVAIEPCPKEDRQHDSRCSQKPGNIADAIDSGLTVDLGDDLEGAPTKDEDQRKLNKLLPIREDTFDHKSEPSENGGEANGATKQKPPEDESNHPRNDRRNDLQGKVAVSNERTGQIER